MSNLTILTAKPGLVMTKSFSQEGVSSYDKAKFFKVAREKVGSIHELSSVLVRLETEPRSCVIRGEFKGSEHAKGIEGAVDSGERGTYFARIKKLFDDKPLHWVMLDVDNYTPAKGIDPQAQPLAAVLDYIRVVLPTEFQGISFHWQLSASAGQPSAKGKLKCHIWFWLEKAYDSVQMTAWAKSVSEYIDVAPLRTVQVHYTANPIFSGGLEDPIPPGGRSGLYEGLLGDEVPLTIDPLLLARAHEQYAGEDSDYEFLDPREKPGVIGAFHRAYPVEEVLTELLAEEFEMEPGSDRRVTWLNGGGSTGGCFITDDRLHFGSTHNSDPFDNRVVNLFDLVRHYRFGHLDEGHDPFEIYDMRDKPSYQAMVDWCHHDPRIIAELDEEAMAQQGERVTERARLTELIRGAASEEELRGRVCAEIQKAYRTLEKVDLDALAVTLQNRLRDLDAEQRRPTIAAVRELMRPSRQSIMAEQHLPNWAEGYYYVTSHDKFYHYPSGVWVSSKGMDHLYNAELGLNGEGQQVFASNLCRDSALVPKVNQALYMPPLGEQFMLDGKLCVNTYVPSSVPELRDERYWTADDREAVRRVERHFHILCGERTEVSSALLDWLAFCVQHPGVKTRYSWLLWGGEGAGKSWVGRFMAAVMGGPNVKLVAVRDVLNPTFNGWAEGAAFSVIEEIRMHGHKRDAWDNLKEPLTNDKLSISRKGMDPYEAPNVTNYIMFSNHHDAVPISLGSRRVAVVQVPFNGDETKGQLEAMAVLEGFDSAEEYFECLFNAIDRHAPALRCWMMTRKLGEGFNPNGWAPYTEERENMAAAGVADDEEVVRMVLEEWGAMDKPCAVNPGQVRAACQFLEHDGTTISAERVSHILAKLGFSRCSSPIKLDGALLRVWTRQVKIEKGGTSLAAQLRGLLLPPVPEGEDVLG